MEKHNTMAVAIVSLVVGSLIGYIVGGVHERSLATDASAPASPGTHMMANGQMMMNAAPASPSQTGMSMEAMMESMKGDLAGKTGDAFDQAFLTEMTAHHQGAVDMANQVLVQAKHQELKDFAKSIIDAQSKEITQMKDWSELWYGK